MYSVLSYSAFDCMDFLQDFDHAVLVLRRSGGIAMDGNKVLIKKSINKYTTFLSHMFEPFLLGYWVSEARTLTYSRIIQYVSDMAGSCGVDGMIVELLLIS